jgi:hypothetical protein
MSGYGERYLRPLFWTFLLLLASSFGYLESGIVFEEKILSGENISDLLATAHYSVQVMALIKPTGWKLLGYSQVIHTVQRIMGPILLGLFALALRQRLRR